MVFVKSLYDYHRTFMKADTLGRKIWRLGFVTIRLLLLPRYSVTRIRVELDKTHIHNLGTE